MRNAILVNYDYCCDCHTCEVACQKEHGYAVGNFGIKVETVGPIRVEGTKKVVFDCMPVLTDLCDLCEERTAKGKLPTCVKHCQTGCLSYGTLEELARRVSTDDKHAILIPRPAR